MTYLPVSKIPTAGIDDGFLLRALFMLMQVGRRRRRDPDSLRYRLSGAR